MHPGGECCRAGSEGKSTEHGEAGVFPVVVAGRPPYRIDKARSQRLERVHVQNKLIVDSHGKGPVRRLLDCVGEEPAGFSEELRRKQVVHPPVQIFGLCGDREVGRNRNCEDDDWVSKHALSCPINMPLS